jgi:hypothetical protein
MRRTLALAAVAAFVATPLLGIAPSFACAPPAEGGGTCSCVRYLYYVDIAGHRVGVPDPTFNPASCD